MATNSDSTKFMMKIIAVLLGLVLAMGGWGVNAITDDIETLRTDMKRMDEKIDKLSNDAVAGQIHTGNIIERVIKLEEESHDHD